MPAQNWREVYELALLESDTSKLPDKSKPHSEPFNNVGCKRRKLSAVKSARRLMTL